MEQIFVFKLFFLFMICFQLNKTKYIYSGIKTINKFLYTTRFKYYKEQNDINTCSLSNGPNCYFTENKYIEKYNYIKTDNNINDEWIYFYNESHKYEYDEILQFFNNYTYNYIEKNKEKIDNEQNSKGEVLKYTITFDNYDKYTIEKDTYFDEKISKIFFNKEIIIDIKGKLKLSYDKDESEDYLVVIDKDYPSKTFGIIESEFISISFQGKVFVCNFCYIKAHDKKSRLKNIYFYGYAGNNVVYTYSYSDKQERREKWLKVIFTTLTPINKLLISGPYDIDNLSFTFPNKEFDFTDLYDIFPNKNIEKLINDEDI
jgi:hypothetical protein